MSAPTTVKCFVGNLSFKTTEDDLLQAFSAAGKVLSANIISRGPRSLGYGFIEFENEVAAKEAVKLLDKKDLGGRPINVEVAKARVEGEEKPPRAAAGGRGRGARGGRGGSGAGSGRSQEANGQEANKETSKTTLFVANLPFSFDNAALKNVYAAYNVKDTHVITRPNGRSKGYGFVEFNNDTDQKKALAATDKTEVEGRVLIVRAALTEFKESLSQQQS